MSGRALTDAQIATALRAHLPQRAQAGLEDRILHEAARSAQDRPLPGFVAGLWDADPTARRRYQLIAATLLLALTLAAVAAVGAVLDDKRLPDPLSLEPPTDVRAYVVDAYEGIAELSALSITILEVEGTKTRWTYNGAGILRLDHYFSPNDAEPGLMRLYTDGVMAEEADLDGEPVWVEYGQQPKALAELAMATGLSTFCQADWDYVGLEYLIGRPAHRVMCGGLEMWLDIETGLALRSINAQDPAIGPTIEFTVLELAVGPQPAELFVAPDDRRTVSGDEYNCSLDPACESISVEPAPSTRPVVTPPPAPGGYAAPADLDAFIDDVLTTHEELPPLEMLVERYQSPFGLDAQWRTFFDGSGRRRQEYIFDPTGARPPTVYLTTRGRTYESYGLTADGRTIWHESGPSPVAESGPEVPTLGLGEPCAEGWEHRGFDLVVGRPAHHLVCRYLEIWVDDDWRLVVRSQRNPDPLDFMTLVWEVQEFRFEQPPAELFELPEDAVVCPGGIGDGVCLDDTGNPMPLPGASPAPSPSG
jgi:hypothetical protein